MERPFKPTFFSSEEQKILSDEVGDLHKLYGCIRGYMDNETKISGIKCKMSYQAIHEHMSLPSIMGRRKVDYHPEEIVRKINRLESVGIIKRRRDLGPMVFEHLMPIIVDIMEEGVNPSKKGCELGCDQDPTYNAMKNNENKKLSTEVVIEVSHTSLNMNNINNIYTSFASQMEGKFKEFWQIYPRKKSKGQARKTFLKLVSKNLPLADKIMDGLKKHIPDLQKQMRENPKYVPHASTWLNAEGWEDEPDSKPKPVTVPPKDFYVTSPHRKAVQQTALVACSEMLSKLKNSQ